MNTTLSTETNVNKITTIANQHHNDEMKDMDKKLQLVLNDNKRMKEEYNKMVQQQQQILQVVNSLKTDNVNMSNKLNEVLNSAGGYNETKIDTKIQDEFRKKQISEFEQVLCNTKSKPKSVINFNKFT